MKFQRGIGLNALMLGGAVLAVASLLVMKSLPPWIEYGNLVKAVKGTASDTSLKDASVKQVQAAFSRRADMDDITFANWAGKPAYWHPVMIAASVFTTPCRCRLWTDALTTAVANSK